MRYLFQIAIVLMTALVGFGCRESPLQVSVEYSVANNFIYLLQSYEAEHPGIRVTNLAQLYLNSGTVYPFPEDKAFRAYGRHAGFTNSFYEKYAFAPSGIRHRFLEGQLVLLNAKPFPDRDGKLGRMLITRVGSGIEDYRIQWKLEESVQQIFQEMGAAMPTPLTMPAPPLAQPEIEFKQPLLSRIRGSVFEFLQVNGMSGSAAWSVWVVLCSLPFLALAVIALMIWKRKGR